MNKKQKKECTEEYSECMSLQFAFCIRSNRPKHYVGAWALCRKFTVNDRVETRLQYSDK